MTTRQNLTVRQGETFSFVYTHLSGGSPVDLTGYTARMSFRKAIGGALWAYLSTGADANGGTVTLGGVLGTVTMAMTATETDALASGVYLPELVAGLEYNKREDFIYDLELVSGAAVTRVLEGQVEFYRSVTS